MLNFARRGTRCLAPLALMLVCRIAIAAGVDVPKHGYRYELGAGKNTLTVLCLKGTPYEMGYAHGKLCAKEIKYIATVITPLMLKGMDCSIDKADQTWAGYTKHLRPEYLEELKGLADGSGVGIEWLQRTQAFPDISEWHCTFFAASGKATTNGDLIQIRALDYDTETGIQKYPALIVSKPDNGVPFVNVGWLGMVGLVTGMNAAGVSMSEIGDDWDKDTDNFDGRPLNFVMRDSVQFGRTIDEAVNLVKDGTRTTSLLYCLSSAKEKQVRALKTSHAQCFVYTPDTLPFSRLPGVVYMSMGMDSNWNQKVGAALKADYGKISVTEAQDFMRRLGTGGLHSVVFKAASGDMWVANATATERGYTQPYIHFNLKDALKQSFFMQ